jgi:hypothetical protein
VRREVRLVLYLGDLLRFQQLRPHALLPLRGGQILRLLYPRGGVLPRDGPAGGQDLRVEGVVVRPRALDVWRCVGVVVRLDVRRDGGFELEVGRADGRGGVGAGFEVRWTPEEDGYDRVPGEESERTGKKLATLLLSQRQMSHGMGTCLARMLKLHRRKPGPDAFVLLLLVFRLGPTTRPLNGLSNAPFDASMITIWWEEWGEERRPPQVQSVSSRRWATGGGASFFSCCFGASSVGQWKISGHRGYGSRTAR